MHLKPCQATIPQRPRTDWVSTKLVCTNNPPWGALPCRLGSAQLLASWQTPKKKKPYQNSAKRKQGINLRMHLITEPAVLQIQIQWPNKGKLPGTYISPLTWAMMGERAPALWGSEVLRDCICLPGHKRQTVICNKALHLMFKSLFDDFTVSGAKIS